MIDWTPVMNAIVALIAVLISTFIPAAIKLFFEMQSARLTKLKAVAENNQEVVDNIVLVIQQTMNALTNSEKYALALRRAEEELHLPAKALDKLIESAVGAAKLTWGEAWKALGTAPTPPTIPTINP
jgi:hypothetical protein